MPDNSAQSTPHDDIPEIYSQSRGKMNGAIPRKISCCQALAALATHKFNLTCLCVGIFERHKRLGGNEHKTKKKK